MLSIDEARVRVARGSAHLDVVRPGWHTQIDVGTLALHDVCDCIMGQLSDGWGRFIDCCACLGLESVDAAVDYGFYLNDGPEFDEFTRAGGTLIDWYRPLQDAWIEAIAARVLADTPAVVFETV